MQFPKDLKYTEEHEWVSVDGNIATVGITDYAQSELGDLVFIELPEVDTTVEKMGVFGTVEAVKAVSDLYAPVSGKIVEVNEVLNDAPETVNKEPYGEGWMIKIEINNKEELDDLLSAEDYKDITG